MKLLTTDLGRFRLVSLLEGISYIVLVAIAMPMKYVAGDTTAVPLLGRIHGGLFVLFCIVLASTASGRGWTRKQTAIAFIAALVPLGAFWLEHQIRRGRFERA